MICLDNSNFTRNGDYTPTRFESQIDAANLVCGAKTNQNPENSVGVLASAGDRVEVIITPTSELGQIVSELPKVKINGISDVLRGIQTAQLALKHRQNKAQKQRIIAFIGSPVTATERECEVLGKNLKKINVSLDLVSFGEVDENHAKLEKLLNAVNSNDTSHLLEIPVGPKLLSDVLLSSPIITPEGEVPQGAASGQAGFEFGINPEEDPELALALRISMEEERARQGGGPAEGGAPVAGADAPATEGAAAAPAGAPAAAMPVANNAALIEELGMDDMDEELRQALLLSMQESGPMEGVTTEAAPVAAAAAEPAVTSPAAPAAKDVEMASGTDAPTSATAAAEVPVPADDANAVDTKWFSDPSFVQDLLGSLPGVDINDPQIQAALKEVKGDDEKKEGGGSSDAAGSGGSGSGSGGAEQK